MNASPQDSGPAPTVLVFDDADEASRHTTRIVEEALRRGSADSPAVLALPTGHTPERLYRRLVARHHEGSIGFEHAYLFDLDEYWPVEASSPWSFAGDLTRKATSVMASF